MIEGSPTATAASNEAAAPGIGQPESRLQTLSLNLMRRCRPYPGYGLLGLLGIAGVVGFGVYFPLSIKALLDNAAGPRDEAAFVRTAVGLLAVFIIYLGAAMLRDRMVAEVTIRVLNRLRSEIFERMQRLTLEFLARSQVGDLTSHFSHDVGAVEQALRVFPSGVQASLQAIVSLIVLFLLNWPLAVAGLVILGGATMGPRLVSGRATLASSDRRGVEAKLSGMAAENIGGQLVIRAFGLQARFRELFETLLGEIHRLSVRSTYLASLTGTLTQGAIVLAEILVISAGAGLVLRDQMGIGSLIGFVGLLMNLGASLTDLSAGLPAWIQATGSLQRIDSLLAQPTDPTEVHQTVALGPVREEIRFHQVGFGYGSGGPGLQGIDLRIPASQFVGIVGSSGSGKSTMLKLLLRVYRPTSGTISLDGTDLQLVTEESLRTQTSVVLQDSFLFDATIAENIRLGRPQATDQEVYDAARAAQIHDTVVAMPKGYETEAGERGDRLSGGQRQRVALARAILRNPAILLLDEATSALDPATEAAFSQTLREISRGRTVISVTHRLATVAEADRILVLDSGRIVEQGTHQELLDQRALYYRLWQKQTGFDLSQDGTEAQIDVDRLSAVPLFSGIEPRLLTPVADLFFTERFAAGVVIFREGDTGDRFSILVRGTAAVTRQKAGGTAEPVEVLEDGDFFGDIDLIRLQARTTSVTARTDCVLLSLSGQHFRRLIEAAPVLRAVFEQVAEVRRQQEAMRAAARQGEVGWSDTT